jgi:hypothetical protein
MDYMLWAMDGAAMGYTHPTDKTTKTMGYTHHTDKTTKTMGFTHPTGKQAKQKKDEDSDQKPYK